MTWVVEHLADHVSEQLNAAADKPLVEVVREAINLTMAEHGSACDLTDPLTPGAALAVVRVQQAVIEWLVLGDCAVAVDRCSTDPLVVIDDRVDHLSGAPVTDAQVRTYDPDFVATVRNQPGGFWVAAATPGAADQALTGEIDRAEARQVLLCSDGVTRLTERHNWTWSAMFAQASQHGPSSLIDAVREADATDPDPRRWRGKAHDDATAALIQLAGSV
ncbi:hypothetical protein Asi03nite_64200 [Actinoplanes siamensis]|uniref:PPM-type phosphatase domain-containing protein n=1 Tax=Actinoplanes siamensis TaxID=1223317 RepID=A0A919NDM1_9ACTN|nr:hypothetical protein Asi03nite_64200 [Actinoplanes siamensis]